MKKTLMAAVAGCAMATGAVTVEPKVTAAVPNNGNDAILNWCIKNNRNNPGEKVELLKPGVYTLAVSVGRKDGKPEIALPLEGGDGRVYPIGKITVTE